VWPHSITIGLGGKAISIGTDTSEVIATLDPWRISDVGEPVDYCLELDPAAAGGGKPYPFPGLYHGATALMRSRDTARLTKAFLRVLNSHARPAGDGQVRISLMPVVRDGVALLAPPASIAAVPDRWLMAKAFDALYTVSSLVDAGRAEVVVDPPLGSDDEPSTLAFGGWWLPARHSDGSLSPGFAVAEAMTLVTDVTAANAGSTLRAVASLVEQAHPTVAPRTVEALKDSLATALEQAARQ
jgi:hypothetical protein